MAKQKFEKFSPYWQGIIIEKNFGANTNKDLMLPILLENNPDVDCAENTLCRTLIRHDLYNAYLEKMGE